MRRGDDNAIRETRFPISVVANYRMGNHRRRRIAPVLVYERVHLVGRENLKSASQCRFGKRMGVYPDKKRSIDVVSISIKTNRLTNRQNMRFVEGVFESGSAVTRGAKGYALRRDARVRLSCEIGGHEARNIEQRRRFDGFSCMWINLVGQ